MNTETIVLRVALLFATALVSAPALAIYKCDSGGSVSYSDSPCPGGKLVPTTDSVSPAETARAEQRAKRQRDELGRIDAERRKTDAQELKNRNKLARAESSQTKKCAQLALRKKSTEDRVAEASKRSMAKARTKALHAADQYELQCSKIMTSTLQKLR